LNFGQLLKTSNINQYVNKTNYKNMGDSNLHLYNYSLIIFIAEIQAFADAADSLATNADGIP
jgi:HPt (histidine-containing phosphotransfer) domain-containing protein